MRPAKRSENLYQEVQSKMPVVVVESPAKAKTINKYLGADYTVLASYGHVRDLPRKGMAVDSDNDFEIFRKVLSFSEKTENLR